MRFVTLALIVGGAITGIAGVALASETITYTYDAQGRVVSVFHNGSVNDGLQTNYSYDDVDSRTSLNVTGSSTPP